jgi:hypothetical protein
MTVATHPHPPLASRLLGTSRLVDRLLSFVASARCRPLFHSPRCRLLHRQRPPALPVHSDGLEASLTPFLLLHILCDLRGLRVRRGDEPTPFQCSSSCANSVSAPSATRPSHPCPRRGGRCHRRVPPDGDPRQADVGHSSGVASVTSIGAGFLAAFPRRIPPARDPAAVSGLLRAAQGQQPLPP